MARQPGGPFLPPNRLARWAEGLLTASMALAVAGIVTSLLVMTGSGEPASDGQLDVKQMLQALVDLLQLLILIGTAVAFLRWFYRVHKNLPALHATNLEFSPGWAVGGFFVPFLNLVRPMQVMREVWYWSDPSGFGFDPSSNDLPVRNRHATPPLIGWWWAFFLLGSFADNLSFRLGMSATSSADFAQLSNVLSIAAKVFDFPAALLAVRLVGNITKWQLERNTRIQQGNANAAVAAAPIA